jgi:hypothetical protein
VLPAATVRVLFPKNLSCKGAATWPRVARRMSPVALDRAISMQRVRMLHVTWCMLHDVTSHCM